MDKVGTRIDETAHLRVKGATPGVRDYVSRGGVKLDGALDDLELDVQGLACLDVGASTGGFTDCLLAHGACSVVALDVGRGQLHEKLRQDPRVTPLERTNARYLTAEQLPGPIDLVVGDVSFISLRLLIEPLSGAAPDARLLLLVKPQFEVGKAQVGKGGVVRDDALRDQAARSITACGEEHGYTLHGRADARLSGPKGNREIFLLFEPASHADA